MLGTFLLVFGFAYDGVISRMDGLILLVIFAGFMVASYQYRERDLDLGKYEDHSFLFNFVAVVGGLTVVVASSYFTLMYVEQLVHQLDLNGSLVGVISIGFAAALPEFSTVIESIRRDSPYLALGTLVGSNVVNPLVGIGSGALVSTYAVPRHSYSGICHLNSSLASVSCSGCIS